MRLSRQIAFSFRQQKRGTCSKSGIEFDLIDWAKKLDAAQHFAIDNGIAQAAWDARLLFAKDALWEPPSGIHLPSASMTLEIDMLSAFPSPRLVWLETLESGDVLLATLQKDHFPKLVAKVDFKDGTTSLHETALGQGEEDLTVLVGMVLSLIGQPRLVKVAPNGTRQQRRADKRGMGQSLDAWHRCSWNIGEDVIAKLSRDPGFHKLPLHYRRGHHRRAESHWTGAYQMPDAMNPDLRDKWFQWIPGDWVGHPAFGVKQHVYSPQLSRELLVKKWGRAA